MKPTKEHIKKPAAVKNLPVISLVFPYELRMNRQASLTKMLTLSADKVEKKLAAKYPQEMVVPVIKKLRHLIAGIECRKQKMSICILVSPLAEKVYYFSPTKELSNYFSPSELEAKHGIM